MRRLSEAELKTVQKAIAQREITSAELLMEVYDHYISHLEEFPEEHFEEQLNALNEKWTYSYCKKLQHDLTKNINKSVRKTQWGLIKSYFSWPKMVFTLIFIGGITLLVNLMTHKMQLMILFGLPIVYLTAFLVFVLVRTHNKIKPIKKTFQDTELKISSIFSNQFITFVSLPLHFYNFFLNVPRIFGMDKLIPEYLLNYLSITFCFIIYLHCISAYEAWKIKSKTALL
jgi:hypothetical protein